MNITKEDKADNLYGRTAVETCGRCGGSGLRFPESHPMYSIGARCVPCGGTGKVQHAK